MAIETSTDVSEMKQVQGADGDPSAPATDAEEHAHETGMDISTGVVQPLVGPGRASELTIHAEPDADAEVRVHFLDAEGGDRITSRTKAENSGFASTGGADIYGQVTALPSRFIEVEIIDMSGGENTADYNLRVI